MENLIMTKPAGSRKKGLNNIIFFNSLFYTIGYYISKLNKKMDCAVGMEKQFFGNCFQNFSFHPRNWLIGGLYSGLFLIKYCNYKTKGVWEKNIAVIRLGVIGKKKVADAHQSTRRYESCRGFWRIFKN